MLKTVSEAQILLSLNWSRQQTLWNKSSWVKEKCLVEFSVVTTSAECDINLGYLYFRFPKHLKLSEFVHRLYLFYIGKGKSPMSNIYFMPDKLYRIDSHFCSADNVATKKFWISRDCERKKIYWCGLFYCSKSSEMSWKVGVKLFPMVERVNINRRKGHREMRRVIS